MKIIWELITSELTWSTCFVRPSQLSIYWCLRKKELNFNSLFLPESVTSWYGFIVAVHERDNLLIRHFGWTICKKVIVVQGLLECWRRIRTFETRSVITNRFYVEITKGTADWLEIRTRVVAVLRAVFHSATFTRFCETVISLLGIFVLYIVVTSTSLERCILGYRNLTYSYDSVVVR